MNTVIDNAMEAAKKIEDFPLCKCGPSDGPDMQYAYAAAFRDISVRFVSYLRRMDDPNIQRMLSVINEDIETSFITEAHNLRSRLIPLIDYLKECINNPAYKEKLKSNLCFVEHEIVEQLRNIDQKVFDLKKLIRFLEELNASYTSGFYLSSILILRAIMNHIPPIFGATTFSQVVASSARSVKAILSRLEEEARPIADLHTHMMIRKIEQLPTRNQIEPYKSSMEILLFEVIHKLEDNSSKADPA